MTDSNDYDDVEDSAVDEDEAQAAEKGASDSSDNAASDGAIVLKGLNTNPLRQPPMSHALLKRLRFLNGEVLTSGAAQFFNLDEYGIA